jgi:hypothetical protein
MGRALLGPHARGFGASFGDRRRDALLLFLLQDFLIGLFRIH